MTIARLLNVRLSGMLSNSLAKTSLRATSFASMPLATPTRNFSSGSQKTPKDYAKFQSTNGNIYNLRNFNANAPFNPLISWPLFLVSGTLFALFMYQWLFGSAGYESDVTEGAKLAGVNYPGTLQVGLRTTRTKNSKSNAAVGNSVNMEKVDRVYEIKKSNPGNIMASCFTREYYNSLSATDQTRLLRCCSSGIGNPSSEMGCYAMGPTDYDDFYAFFKCVLEKYHKVNLDETKHVNDWELKGKDGLPADGVLDVTKFGISEPLSMRIRTARNLKNFPLPGAMTAQNRKDMELAMKPVFDSLIANPEFGGEYVSLTPGHPNQMSDARYKELVKAHIMFKDMSADSFLVDAGIAGDWPNGRGCYVSADKGFIIWVGEEDHLRIMAMKKSLVINDVFDRLKAAIDVVEDLIPGGCAKSKDFGVITSCPTNMGTGMRASVHIKIPNLTSDGSDEAAKKILKPYGLGVRGLGGEHTPIGADGTVDISPKARFCISEAQIAIALYKGVEKVINEENNAGK